jgi:uncharacterized protein (DUF885 family)
MKHLLYTFLVLLTTSTAVTAQPVTKQVVTDSLPHGVKQMNSLTKAYGEDLFNLYNPADDSLYNNLKENYFTEAKRRREKLLNIKYLNALKSIDKKTLPPASLIDYEVMKTMLEYQLHDLKFEWYLMPCYEVHNSLNGIFSVLGRITYAPYKTVQDYDACLQRIAVIPSTCDTAIANMRTGIRKNIVQPKVMMQKVVVDLQDWLNTGMEKNEFYQPVLNMPGSFSEADKQRLTGLYRNAINAVIIPSYQRLLYFIKKEYLPACRESIGIAAYPRGREAYQAILKNYYGSDITADAMMKKIKVITYGYDTELKNIMDKHHFKGDVNSFGRFLSRDTSLCIFKTNDEIIARFRQIGKMVDEFFPKYFKLIPNVSFNIIVKPGGGGGRFQSMEPDTGLFTFYINDAHKYSYPGMEKLYLHEADPGHHNQMSLQYEFIPSTSIRKDEYFEAFTEGWATYAESLGKEMGLYKDDYSYAAYLVSMHSFLTIDELDIGIHLKGWSFEQAVNYGMTLIGYTKERAEANVLRFMTDPGQVHSYAFGFLKIVEMRNLAQQQLGKAFDIKEFHAQVLKDGSLPLNVFENKIRRWIAEEKGKAKKKT